MTTVSTRTNRLAGHSLIAEGAAFLGSQVRAHDVSGPGMGKCSCGEMSEVLPSRGKRKKWHREHKDEVRGR